MAQASKTSKPVIDITVTREKLTNNFAVFGGVPIARSGKPSIMTNMQGQIYVDLDAVEAAKKIRVTVEVVE